MKDQLDPFRALLGVIASEKECDLMVAAAGLAGLRIDLSVPEKNSGSRVERIRVLQPRILKAYDDLDDASQLAAAQAAVTNLGPKAAGLLGRVEVALNNIGWAIDDGRLVAVEPSLREMFFPKDSQWDAFVVLGQVMGTAQRTVTIVDAYADRTVFEFLTPPPQPHLCIKVLCSHYAAAVAAAAKRFRVQFAGITTEVRSASKHFHDRFVIVDEEDCVHVGASLKDAGKTAFMISRVEDEANRLALLTAIHNAWSAGTVLT
jgi:hypothetical protein